MPDIAKVKLNNTTYNVRDDAARQTLSSAVKLGFGSDDFNIDAGSGGTIIKMNVLTESEIDELLGI